MNDVRVVRAFIRARGRAPVSWSDRYVSVFTLTVVALVLADPLTSALAAVTAGASQVDPSRLGAGIAVVTLGYAGFLSLARMFGPVVLPAADAAWLLLSPLPRRSVLRRTSAILLAVSLAAGAALSLALFAVLAGSAGHGTLVVVTAVVVGLSAAVGGMGAAVIAQSSPAWDSWLRGAVGCLVVAAVLAAVAGSGPGRHALAAVADAPRSLGAAVVSSSAATALVLVRQAWRALGRIRASSLLATSTRAGHIAAAAVVMDPGALTWAAEENHWRARTLRSRPWPALLSRGAPRPLRAVSAPLATAWHDWRRLVRRPRRSAALLGTAALPALAAQALGGTSPVAVAVLATGALAAAVVCTAGARRDAENPGLARLLGVNARAVLAARALLPALMSAAWLSLALVGLVVTGALTGSWWLLGPLAAPALAAGALRMARRRPIDHSLPVIDTPAGPVPTGWIVWAMTGVDLTVLGCAPLLVALMVRPPVTGALLVAQSVFGVAILAAFLLGARTGVRRG
ncbi:hypothetical protein GCM10023194_35470 [Planotetraspora phitsanulokensis]|uniref:Uncharacterized protein n=1 Tax=Planotetraspora phitsanulokensis TaxID=575192 RepID=A0A8J3U133_9ACTN|nr:DUF6297 family protein [Planotetraspora phitsanulokensis]GII36325.1 hypothetical protein Pph01_13280 [Planotetraspora phitsanulokensis]